MAVARASCGVNAILIYLASLLDPAQLFQSLAAMRVGGSIVWIAEQQTAELIHSFSQIAHARILHRQAVAGKTVLRISCRHCLQRFEPVVRHVSSRIPGTAALNPTGLSPRHGCY